MRLIVLKCLILASTIPENFFKFLLETEPDESIPTISVPVPSKSCAREVPGKFNRCGMKNLFKLLQLRSSGFIMIFVLIDFSTSVSQGISTFKRSSRYVVKYPGRFPWVLIFSNNARDSATN